jgi:FkbM family methyltransferase
MIAALTETASPCTCNSDKNLLLKSNLNPLMVTLKGLFLTLKTTRNFWDTLKLRKSKEKKKITFRNGCELDLTWPEYTLVRDILSKGYSVEHFDELLCFKKGEIQIVGPLSLIGVLNESLDELYSLDFRNKVVLDVGGFIGETAVFFSAWGATKVIIYEPVVAYHEFIKINLALNDVNAELHDEGLGETDGYATVKYETAGSDFGLSNEGTKEMKIKTKSAKRMIEESNADLAKFDCEGAEKSLINVPNKVLRRIGFYIIEVHTSEIKNAILDKFRNSGFALVKDIPNVAYEVSVVFFQRN